jgi:hypothetical protein
MESTAVCAQKKKKARKKSGKGSFALGDQLKTGMPAPDTVQRVVKAKSPQGEEFEILKTSETDAYDKPPEAKRKRRPRS